MGRFLKALVMTLLIMEITAIVDLTAVWTLLAELHTPQTIVNIALAISVVGLAVLAFVVYRRAIRAEHRLESETEVVPLDMPTMPAIGAGINAVGPTAARSILPPPPASPRPRHAR
ncbi:hypothetical protein [Hyphomonas chukchiensis]|uniref:Uncharacterized protein n=1 Tax=Hyphomonas chukchiensis TaxID=1280947 RepID=A0A062UKX0_9PROT|nr:hypothetical protein [Hyphomonas chukchiensis]KCZ60206.1 hypothetical protein HY30_12110 [Hyphomonas chukchiensis]|tara:strand:+ start:678 stop:1025 length:348 start_codon:yes stop_codon:yes gene_type:complete